MALNESAAAFSRETGVSSDQSGPDGLLEKKWISVTRLQKKVLCNDYLIQVLELESTLAKLEDQVRKLPPKETAAVPTQLLTKLEGHRSTVTCLKFHSAFPLLVTGSEDCTAKIWDLETGKCDRTLRGHTKAITAIEFSKERIITASADATIKIFNFEGSCTKTLFGHDDAVTSLSVHGDRLISSSRDTTVKLWDLSSGECIHTFMDHQEWVRCAVFSHDGSLIASAGNERTIYVWNASTWQIVSELRGHEHVIEALEFLRPELFPKEAKRDDFYLMSCSRDRTIRIWNGASGVQVHCLVAHENWVKSLSIHPELAIVASVGDDKMMRIWDLHTWKEIKEVEVGFMSCIRWSPTMGLVACGGQDTQLWKCK